MHQARTLVITGAAGGVGSVLADRFLNNGDTVVATDTDADVLAQWRGRRAADAKLLTAAADVCSEADCGRLADVVREEAGRLDVLSDCAGFFPIFPFEEMTSATGARSSTSTSQARSS